ncbi:type II CRISPR RNA-guided endonuclease Cas9 [Pseudoscardovia suis]
MSSKTYRIGIDVGLYSVGLAAIQINEDGNPVRILNAQSVIHDGGVDPSAEKSRGSRRLQSGIARRTRRMRRNRKKRLERLDQLLVKSGFPVSTENDLEGFEPWILRAQAADGFIEDDATRKRAIAVSCRHMARHRGWRNPYLSARTLLAVDSPSSAFYDKLVENAAQMMDGQLPEEEATPAQIVRDVLEYRQGSAAIRLRKSTAKKKKDRFALFPEKMMQEDNAYELRLILSKQSVPQDVARKLLLAVFESQSPKGSAEKRVGKDPLDPSQPRALKASLAFQHYRMLNMITNLRLADNGVERRLSVEEKQKLYQLLLSDTGRDKKYDTWTDVASAMGWKRSQLKGVGSLTSDGEDRVTSKPPHVDIIEKLNDIKDSGLRKRILGWWGEATESERESMVALLSNTVDIAKKQDDPEFSSAVKFIDALNDDDLQKLDGIDMQQGRAAYSSKTLCALTQQMLTTEDDLHDARKHVFYVDDSWRPPQPAIGAPLGNPSVDRVAKIVNRWLLACQSRWGNPVSIQIEHVRDALSSAATLAASKSAYDRAISARNLEKQETKDTLRREMNLSEPHESDIRRIEAITRQGGKCLYCGTPIEFTNCEMDHIVPRKGPGSTNTRDNFAAVCITCNRQKGNVPFAVWCQTPAAVQRGVSLEKAVDRVSDFFKESKSVRGRQATAFKKSMIMRLKQAVADDPIDNRSIESVAWMADELHRRIDWHFNGAASSRELEAKVQVAVYQGRITSEARNVMRFQAGGDFHFVGGHGKTRLDRRHHAVDASVIAMMTPAAAQTLAERMNIRDSQRYIGRIEEDEVDWKQWPAKPTEKYQQWLNNSTRLFALINEALDADRIPVTHWQRYSLGNSIAHDATIKPLLKVPLGSAISKETINRAATPALYCALTGCADYSPTDGLPENKQRHITVNGTIYGPDDVVEFFKDDSAQIAVQGGSADIGNAIHHARVYRCYTLSSKGVKKWFYGMIRVFQADLVHARHDDLFTYPLSPQSISMRYAESRTAQAVLDGRAEYLGNLVVGDEIDIPMNRELKGQIATCVVFFNELPGNHSLIEKWSVDGFYSDSTLRLRPLYLAGEGLPKLGEVLGVEIPADIQKILVRPGWLPSVNTTFSTCPQVIRRNSLGEPRWKSCSGMPVSWRILSSEEA